MMTIGDYLSPRGVVFLQDSDRTAVTRELIERAAATERLPDPEVFSQAIFDRESLLSTAVGRGVAVPHAKIAGIPQFFVVIGISSTPVEWDAPDREPVNLVFLIGGPADEQTRYLQILAKAMLVVKNDELRDRLREAPSPEAAIDVFSGM